MRSAHARYQYRHVYAEGVGHVDQAVLEQTLTSTLFWLWQGHPTP